MEHQKMYIAIDLKSFYASVECMERKLDPLKTNLVVADASRTNKTICLAVSPSLKSYGIPSRARLFEVEQKVKNANQTRLLKAGCFTGSSFDAVELKENQELQIDYVIAMPQMKRYMEISSMIYNIYLKYIAPEDIHVYSIDEVLMDVTGYLKTYGMTAHELAMTMIRDVLKETGITATAGIGTNLYLCKVAMDIVAKHIPADENGVRIAELDEISYRKLLWSHEPLTDFWRVGAGIARKLHEHNIFTMGDIARCSLGKQNDYYNEDFLYNLFGINAELLIDHAWGWEPVTMKDIKDYKPDHNSIGNGQVLPCAYDTEKARLATHEMVDALSLELVDKSLVTNQIVLTVGYDRENLNDSGKKYHGTITKDYYGRKVPKSAHGTMNIEKYSNSTKLLTDKTLELFDRIVDPNLTIRRIYLTLCKVIPESEASVTPVYEQLDLFTDYKTLAEERKIQSEKEAKEKKLQQAMLKIKKKFGKNAVLKGMNLQDGATGKDRNNMVGGHKA